MIKEAILKSMASFFQRAVIATVMAVIFQWGVWGSVLPTAVLCLVLILAVDGIAYSGLYHSQKSSDFDYYKAGYEEGEFNGLSLNGGNGITVDERFDQTIKDVMDYRADAKGREERHEKWLAEIQELAECEQVIISDKAISVFTGKGWSAKDVVEHVKRNGEPKEGAIIWRMP